MLNLLFGLNGRIGRASWWLAQFIAVPVVYLLGFGLLMGTGSIDDPEAMASGPVVLGIIAPVFIGAWINVASSVKRYHDRGKSGAWFLIVFIPFIGSIWQLVECGFCIGDDRDNRFGPPPGSGRTASEAQEDRGNPVPGNASLAKLDDEYFRNYAAKQHLNAPRSSEPIIQSTYARPAATVSPGGARPVFGRR